MSHEFQLLHQVKNQAKSCAYFQNSTNDASFSFQKIQYACRKTLADSRPRVRGRFAKNDDFGDGHRQGSSNHEEDEEEARFSFLFTWILLYN